MADETQTPGATPTSAAPPSAPDPQSVQDRGFADNATLQRQYGPAYHTEMDRVGEAIGGMGHAELDALQSEFGLSKLVEIGRRFADHHSSRLAPEQVAPAIRASLELDRLHASEEFWAAQRGTPAERAAMQLKADELSRRAYGWTGEVAAQKREDLRAAEAAADRARRPREYAEAELAVSNVQADMTAGEVQELLDEYGQSKVLEIGATFEKLGRNLGAPAPGTRGAAFKAALELDRMQRSGEGTSSREGIEKAQALARKAYSWSD